MGHQTELTVPEKRKTAYVLGKICEGKKIMDKSIFCYGKHRAHQNTDIGSWVLALCYLCKSEPVQNLKLLQTCDDGSKQILLDYFMPKLLSQYSIIM